MNFVLKIIYNISVDISLSHFTIKANTCDADYSRRLPVHNLLIRIHRSLNDFALDATTVYVTF